MAQPADALDVKPSAQVGGSVSAADPTPPPRTTAGPAVAASSSAPAGEGKARPQQTGQRSRRKKVEDPEDDPSKRRCVSTACIACRKRKSKCDGNTPACAACSQVYGTPCIYDPNSDHRRKGVYKNDFDNSKARNATLHTLIEAILNYPEHEALDLVRELRQCDSLDAVAERIAAKDNDSDWDGGETPESDDNATHQQPTFERQLYGRMGDLRLDDGTVRYIGGTSHLIHIDNDEDASDTDEYPQHENAVASWTAVTDDANLVMHLLNMYFTWHYPFFTTLSRTLFYRDFLLGKPPPDTKRKTHYCTSVLVNAMLAIGCHFTSHVGARSDPDDSATAGDHFFREAKRLIMENDEHERPRLTNIQAFALMSVREAGCGREAKGWVYSGMSFRMLLDMGLNLNTGRLTKNKLVNGNEAEEDVRRITFWGCYLFDKCWSNYLGRLPQLPTSLVTAPKFEVFLDEDAASWSPYTDSGHSQANSQPARTRAVALQISKLCEISNDLMRGFYNPADMEKQRGKSAELKMLSSIHTRLEAWRRELPKELEPCEGGLASVLLMHMLFQLLFIHLFRPFLRYTPATSPLPPNVSPRKHCTQAAAMISKLMRLYKRSHGLRQICNIAVYIAHSACTIHLLNLPDRNAKRDLVHGVKHLEEIAEGWLCARRSLAILSILARKWKVQLPEDAATVLARTDKKFSKYSGESKQTTLEPVMNPSFFSLQQAWVNADDLPGVAPFADNTNMMGMDDNKAPLQATSAMYPHPPIQDVKPNVANLRAPQQQQNQPPNAATAAIPKDATRSPVTAAEATRNMPSPSEMFGGVEQLIREGSEWVWSDQAQMVTGFGTWATMNMDPSTWANANAGLLSDDPITTAAAAAAASAMNGTAFAAPAPTVPGAGVGAAAGAGAPNMNSNPAVSGAGGAGGGYLVADWLNSQGIYHADNSMAVYNEREWYNV